jgi:hypothetical protein
MGAYEINTGGVPPCEGEPLLDCPTCGLPAEITDRFVLGGAPGPVEHVKLVCVGRHWYTLPVDQIPRSAPAHEHSETAARNRG